MDWLVFIIHLEMDWQVLMVCFLLVLHRYMTSVKGIRVISYSLGFPHVLSIYAPLWASIQ